MIIRTDEDLKNLRTAGGILSSVLDDTVALVREGGTAAELDLFADHAIRAQGAVPAFFGYQPQGAEHPYPATICVSVNDEVVHGLPTERKIFNRGDVVKVDIGLSFKGRFVDGLHTVIVGQGDVMAQKLVAATKEALEAGIAAAHAGAHVGDIGAAIAFVARKYRLSVAEDLGGHGVGESLHEPPYIPNEGARGEGEVLQDGQVIAVEPIFCEGSGAIVLAEDGWTYRTRDRKRSAEAEATIIVRQGPAEVLTRY
jgi:methionyl aminopeptidase